MQAQIITLIVPIMTLIFSAIFVWFWSQDRERIYILAYAYWFAAVALGIIFQIWIVKHFGPFEVVAFHALSSSGLIALLWGVAKRDNEPVPMSAFVAITAVTGAILWFARAYDVQSVVLMAQNYNAGLLFAMGAFGRWHSARRAPADKALMVTLMLLAAYAMFRPSITIILNSAMTMEQYQSSVMLSVNMAVTALLCLVVSLALIATVITDTMQTTRKEATQDPLTGLPARGAFVPMAQALMDRGVSERVPVCLIVADIDHFKRINDTFGHSAGDAVISSFGDLIAGRIRPGDAAGRIGGEEFCILAWNCSEEGACALADRLRAAFAVTQHRGLPKEERVTASFGVAQVHPGSDYTRTFERADAALYSAKRSGRDCVVGDGAVAPKPAKQFDDAEFDENSRTSAEIVRFSPRKAAPRS